MNEDDKKLWETIVAAEKQVAAARAAFYEKAKSRHDSMATALYPLSSGWDKSAVFGLLRAFPDTIPELLEELVELATVDAYALASRRLIDHTPITKLDAVASKVQDIVRAKLADPDIDGQDYRRLAELLRHLRDQEMLAELVQHAKASSDPEIREVGEDFSQEVQHVAHRESNSRHQR